MRVYAPVRFPKVGSFESPLAQHHFDRCAHARELGDLYTAAAAYDAACAAERAYHEAVQVRFAC